MSFMPQRRWLLVAIVISLIGALVINLAVAYCTRERPNYSQVEPGLWLGGYVNKPPPGTKSVLNLCERKDPYTVESHRWEPIADAEPVPSLDWLQQQIEFIDSERA